MATLFEILEGKKVGLGVKAGGHGEPSGTARQYHYLSKLRGNQQTGTDAISDLLENYRNQIDAYTENAKFLLKRSGSTTQQLSDTLAFKINMSRGRRAATC